MSVNSVNIIKKSVRNKTGLLQNFTFEPHGGLVQEFSDLITVNCEKSGYVDLGSDKSCMDVMVELHNQSFKRIAGRPVFPMRLFTDDVGTPHLSFSNDLTQPEFLAMMGMAEEELDVFKNELITDISQSFIQQDITNRSFRINLFRVGGVLKHVKFRPVNELVAEYVSHICIRLDLSSFIDLQNKPKKGSKLKAAKLEEAERLKNLGLSDEEIQKLVAAVTVIDPQYDLMLELYYSTLHRAVPLGMYTQPNDSVKFSNGTEENLYQDDFIKTMEIPQKELPKFKQLLNEEVLDVLTQLGIDFLDNSAHALGLEEPWAAGAANPATTVQQLRQQRKSQKQATVAI